MRSRFAPAFVIVLIGSALVGRVDAGQRDGALPGAAAPSLLPSGPSATQPAQPFAKLFQPSVPVVPGSGSARNAAPRVACGMTLVPVDPAFDARMRRQPPDKPRPASKSVQAPKCD
jgi:hypothetical protein